MAKDPLPALMEMAKTRPDPKTISTWLAAYLGKRTFDEKHSALNNLEQALNALWAGPAEIRARNLILQVLKRTRSELKK